MKISKNNAFNYLQGKCLKVRLTELCTRVRQIKRSSCVERNGRTFKGIPFYPLISGRAVYFPTKKL